METSENAVKKYTDLPPKLKSKIVDLFSKKFEVGRNVFFSRIKKEKFYPVEEKYVSKTINELTA
ncbi:hypothetical protein FUAX_10010 [Fulvitalea axinellae]|uniref:Uncharacterized protein n=1 Tax=Fulvitalea axinellae TaxID=1182444 RepID=A0AAU9D2F2_9BACT|nr:hypothetical protein FUAX_10010 [Fulvitalea axinellae]